MQRTFCGRQPKPMPKKRIESDIQHLNLGTACNFLCYTVKREFFASVSPPAVFAIGLKANSRWAECVQCCIVLTVNPRDCKFNMVVLKEEFDGTKKYPVLNVVLKLHVQCKMMYCAIISWLLLLFCYVCIISLFT